jgi:hypothetical protein
MTMNDLIFEIEQPNEILSCPEWTEWWAIDDTGLHLEYAPGYEPENFETETCIDDTKSIYIDVNLEYDNKMQYLQERYEEAFGKLDDNYVNNLYIENDIDLFAENVIPSHKPFPISTSSIDYEEWPSDYLEHLRGIIDEYNSPNADWRRAISNLRADESSEDQEESVVDLPSTDGLILPN